MENQAVVMFQMSFHGFVFLLVLLTEFRFERREKIGLHWSSYTVFALSPFSVQYMSRACTGEHAEGVMAEAVQEYFEQLGRRGADPLFDWNVD